MTIDSATLVSQSHTNTHPIPPSVPQYRYITTLSREVYFGSQSIDTMSLLSCNLKLHSGILSLFRWTSKQVANVGTTIILKLLKH